MAHPVLLRCVGVLPGRGAARAILGLAAALGAASLGHAAPWWPGHDAQVIEHLPPRVAPRSVAPSDAPAAARRLVQQARASGDPRPAGQALALLARWRDDPGADAATVIALADAEQFVHDFEPALARLQALVQRDPTQRQAWLMLATLHRVTGRYAQSDTACTQVGGLHGAACRAENAALRGRFDVARYTLALLIATAPERADRAWLATTLAELEERAGRADAADAAYRAALQSQADGYTAIAYADFLIAQRRGAEALPWLQRQPPSDAVLLRQVMIDPLSPAGRDAAATLRERFARADRRAGDDVAGHDRERALFALAVERDSAAALRFARRNVQHQREPLDLLLLARAARAAGDVAALRDARRLVQETGLEDRRIDAYL